MLTIDAILDKARRHFDLPISGGHIRGSDIRGQYNGQAKTVRTKITNDLPAAFHEIGHHLNREYKLVRNMPLNVKKEVTRALSEAMQERYGDNLGQMWSEAFAEYLRQYMQNSETARIDYPLTTAYMQEKLYADTLAFVNELADDVNAYYSLSADDATAEVISRAESEKDGRGVAEILHGTKEKAYQDWVDQNHGIRVFDKATGANAYTLASNSAYADAVAGQILTGDLTDPDGRYVAPGLRDALSSVDMTDKNEYAAFGEYLVCRHGPERLAEGMRVFANDAKNSSAWMERRAAVLEKSYPQFREAGKKLYAFQSAFLKTWGVQTGLVSEKNAKAWAERWQCYVPFNRAMGDNGKYGIGAKRGFGNQDSTIRRSRGSGRTIVNPVDNIITNVVRIQIAAIDMLSLRRVPRYFVICAHTPIWYIQATGGLCI